MAKRRRSKPARAQGIPRRLSTPPPPPSAPATTNQQDRHRLAVIELDNGGSVGSALTLFVQAAEKVAERAGATPPLTADAMSAEAAALRRQVAEATALADAASRFRHAELEAAALRRRLRRTIAAEERRLDRERRRAEGGLYAGQSRAENRPTRLAVDPAAWEVLKRDAIRRRMAVGYLAGRLVNDAVRRNRLPRVDDHDRCATQRFARLVLVEPDVWTAFRSMAFDARVTTTRMVGVVVENEARRLGWKP